MQSVRLSCSICGLREVCLPCDVMLLGAGRVEDVVVNERAVRKGESLFLAGDPHHHLFTVRAGSFKTTQSLGGGREQVTGLRMSGDMLAAEGIDSGLQACDAVALEDSRVCAIPYSSVVGLGRRAGPAARRLSIAMGEMIASGYRAMFCMANLTADGRIAQYLLELSQRHFARGCSPSDFDLGMSQKDIGSLVGLRVETVCRSLSKFEDEGLIAIEARQVRLLDPACLTAYASLDRMRTRDARARPAKQPAWERACLDAPRHRGHILEPLTGGAAPHLHRTGRLSDGEDIFNRPAR